MPNQVGSCRKNLPCFLCGSRCGVVALLQGHKKQNISSEKMFYGEENERNKCVHQRVLNNLQRTRLSRRHKIRLTPPPLSRQQVVSFCQSSCVSLGQLSVGKGGGGARSQIIKPRKAWPSINHSLLPDVLQNCVIFRHVDALVSMFQFRKRKGNRWCTLQAKTGKKVGKWTKTTKMFVENNSSKILI